jgi:hypothetical protein
VLYSTTIKESNFFCTTTLGQQKLKRTSHAHQCIKKESGKPLEKKKTTVKNKKEEKKKRSPAALPLPNLFFYFSVLFYLNNVTNISPHSTKTLPEVNGGCILVGEKRSRRGTIFGMEWSTDQKKF